MTVNAAFNRPFQEQVDFFRKKINLPSERWDDIWKSAHDRAFIVAGAMKADLVSDFRTAVDRSIAEGKSLEWFRSEFDNIVQKHGWSGWTGEGSKKGRDWRTRVIYQTNMSASYAAGRWQQLNDPDLIKIRPYFTYHHADGVRHPRPLHVSWNGFTAPRDHPFWPTHACPNGYFCHCFITAASQSDYEAAKSFFKDSPPVGWDKIDPKTGEQVGIDKGFGYAPGANADKPMRSFVQDKLVNYEPAVAKMLSHDLNRKLIVSDPPEVFAEKVLADKTIAEPLWVGFVENFEAIKAKTELDLQGYLVLITSDAVRHVEKSHAFDGKGQRPVKASDYTLINDVINDYDEIKLGSESRHQQPTLIVTKLVDGETYRMTFQVLQGKKNRTLQLVSMLIKTKQK